MAKKSKTMQANLSISHETPYMRPVFNTPKARDLMGKVFLAIKFRLVNETDKKEQVKLLDWKQRLESVPLPNQIALVQDRCSIMSNEMEALLGEILVVKIENFK